MRIRRIACVALIKHSFPSLLVSDLCLGYENTTAATGPTGKLHMKPKEEKGGKKGETNTDKDTYIDTFIYIIFQDCQVESQRKRGENERAKRAGLCILAR